MAVAAPKLLTYGEYLREGETNWRYDIIDGVRVNMPSPNPRHQRIAQKITRLLGDYEAVSQRGFTLAAPCDVQITQEPLRTRQPDVFFVSHERMRGLSLDDPPPLAAVPELVVEVISDSDTRRVFGGKITDFCAIGVNECWVVRPESRTVEVLRLTHDGPETVATYGEGETVVSLTMPGLQVAVADVFTK